MLEIHDVAGLPLGRDPGVDPCRKGLEKTSSLVTWPNHINLNFLTLFASRILAPMMSLISSRIDWLVRRSWYVTPKRLVAILFYRYVLLQFGPTVNLLLIHCGPKVSHSLVPVVRCCPNVIPLFGSYGSLWFFFHPTLWFLCPAVPM